jgi:hypothetical protein
MLAMFDDDGEKKIGDEENEGRGVKNRYSQPHEM